MTPTLDSEQLLARLATVVGAEHVSALADDSRYNGLLPPGQPVEQRPRAVVLPASAEQVQRLAPMIAELGHGLWHSPNACGNGAQAGHRGKPGVLLDLRRMNRIIEVDRHAACAVLEAGVSFEQLAAHLRERDLPLWLDADANGAHAVAGSVADRQWGLTPYGDHQAAQCGLEVVLANGALLRTGMGALPGSDCWPRYKHNFGPALDGLFARAHFGVVTKLGLWLMPAPLSTLLRHPARPRDSRGPGRALKATAAGRHTERHGAVRVPCLRCRPAHSRGCRRRSRRGRTVDALRRAVWTA